jgi:hypothetical protein
VENILLGDFAVFVDIGGNTAVQDAESGIVVMRALRHIEVHTLTYGADFRNEMHEVLLITGALYSKCH